MKNIKILLLIITVQYLAVGSAWAQDKKLIDSFINQGIKLYEKGDINGAIDDLSRALLLDPHNDKAQSNLIKLISHPSLAAKERMNILVFEDLMDYIRKIKGKIDYVEFKNSLLENELHQKGYSNTDLEKEMKHRNIYILDAQKRTEIKNTEAYKDAGDPIEVVNSSLNYEKKELSNKLVYLQSKYNFFRELNREIPRTSNVYEPVRDQVLKRSYPSDDENLYDRKEDIKSFTAELKKVRLNLHKTQKNLEEKDEKVVDLTKEIVDLSLRLAEKEKILTDKVEELTSLNADMIDLQERFKLEKKIINEKDDQIDTLQNEIKEAHKKTKEWRKELDEALSSKMEKENELNSIVEIYKKKLLNINQEIKLKSADIITLEDQIESVQRELYNKDKFLNKTKNDLEYFELELIHIKEAILNLKSYPRQAGYYNPEVVEKDILELYAQIRDAQKYLLKKLKDFEKMNILFESTLIEK